jgi:hypothetical protein
VLRFAEIDNLLNYAVSEIFLSLVRT